MKAYQFCPDPYLSVPGSLLEKRNSMTSLSATVMSMSPTATQTDLRVELAARGISQWKLAAATGIHPSQISRYVNGLKPGTRNRALIAEALRQRQGESS